jgi:hypothetical protein
MKTDAEIQEVLDIGGDDNRLRHVLFAYLILREPLLTCIYIGSAFEHLQLTLAVARVIADGW